MQVWKKHKVEVINKMSQTKNLIQTKIMGHVKMSLRMMSWKALCGTKAGQTKGPSEHIACFAISPFLTI